MSKKFIYTICTNDDGALYPSLGMEDFKDQVEILILPEVSKEMRRKEIIEMSGNLLQEITASLSNRIDRSKEGEVTEDGFEKEFVVILKELGNFMQYMLNSTSFHTGTIEVFDHYEFRQRLDRIITSLDYSRKRKVGIPTEDPKEEAAAGRCVFDE